jgi:hypothetical protein
MRDLLLKITTDEHRRAVRRLLNVLKKPFRRIGHFLRYLDLLIFWSHYPEKKFFIFGEGRGGSSLLVNLLNSHPDIYCDGEIFNAVSNTKIRFPRLYLKSRKRITRLIRKPVYGFKVKYTQLVIHQGYKKDFIENLHNSGWKIIYLKRNNYLKATISTILAEKRKYYQKKGNKVINLEKVSIDVEELYKKTKGRERAAELEKEWLIGCDYCYVNYENDLLNSNMHQDTLDRIFQFLEIPSAQVYTNYRKVSAGDLSRDIKNFDEVKEYFSSSEYAHFLYSD